MSAAPNGITRRVFVRATLAAGGALVLHPVRAQGAAPAAAKPTAQLGTMIVIHPDNRVQIGCRAPEIGQGVKTALPMMVAEELDARWADVTVTQLPLAVDFGASPPAWRFGPQGAGGSTTVSDAWDDHRQFGADARALLVAAAAQAWGSGDSAPLRTAQGWVLHPDGRRLSYGELAARAAALPPLGKAAPLKDPRDFRIVGTPQRVTDARDIVTGRARYGLDTPLAGIEAAAVAVLLRCPYVDGGIAALDDSAARRVPGVYDVLVIAGPEPGAALVANLATAVAVVARDTWSALRGRAALQVRWTTGPHAGESSAAFDEQCQALLAAPGQVVLDKGDFAAARDSAARVVQASYRVPFAAHAPMEPPNAFVQLWPDRALVIAPLQQPGGVPRLVMNLTGITRDKVEVRMTRAGGGFGRRLTNDAVAEAVLVAKASGRPVKLMWTRDDDLQHDFYRPAGWHAMSAALDGNRRVVAWHHKLASASKHHRRPNQKPEDLWQPELYPDDFPAHRVANLRLEWCAVHSGVPRGSWRAPAHWANAFAVQSFIDEIAHASAQDALTLRLQMLGAPEALDYTQHGGPKFDTGRLAAVLQRVAAVAGWGRARPGARKGRGLGLACHFTFGGYAAHAIDVSVSGKGELKIHNIVCAVDVGQPINPLGIEAQMQGGTIDGLQSALLQEITHAGGRVQQGSFADYPLLPLRDTPPVQVVVMPSAARPSGCGEMGIPTVAPALANAIFNACGVRLRRLPIKDQLRRALA